MLNRREALSQLPALGVLPLLPAAVPVEPKRLRIGISGSFFEVPIEQVLAIRASRGHIRIATQRGVLESRLVGPDGKLVNPPEIYQACQALQAEAPETFVLVADEPEHNCCCLLRREAVDRLTTGRWGREYEVVGVYLRGKDYIQPSLGFFMTHANARELCDLFPDLVNKPLDLNFA